jgi:hypothetical protein
MAHTKIVAKARLDLSMGFHLKLGYCACDACHGIAVLRMHVKCQEEVGSGMNVAHFRLDLAALRRLQAMLG